MLYKKIKQKYRNNLTEVKKSYRNTKKVKEKYSSGDNKPNKLPLTNVSLGSGGDHDDDDGVFLPEHDISRKL